MPTATPLGTSGQGLCVNKPKADDPFQRGEPQATGFSRVVVDNSPPALNFTSFLYYNWDVTHPLNNVLYSQDVAPRMGFVIPLTLQIMVVD